MQFLKELATPFAILVLAGVLLYDHLEPEMAPSPSPAPSVNAKALGKTYGPLLILSYAEAWEAAAKTLEEGKSVSEAQKSLQDTWKDARIKAFRSEIQPGMNLVLPEGTEPASTEKRLQVAELWRSFASGLKGAAGR